MGRLILAASVGFALTSIAQAQTGAPTRLEVFPSDRILHGPYKSQQLAVIAHYADGRQVDVTQLTQFKSTDDEIASVSLKGKVVFWKTGDVAIYCRYRTMQTVRLSYVEPKPGFVWPNPPQHNPIDSYVFAKLRQLQIAPSALCSDTVFLRRAYLDLLGLLPTSKKAKEFMEDSRADKRARLIDELLERPEFAELWAYQWGTLWVQNLERHKPIQSAAYLHWLRGRIRANAPLDQIVRDVLTGIDVVTEFGPASYYTDGDPAQWASRTSEMFLGVRLQCAECHPHFNTRWTTSDWHQFTAFFGQTVSRSIPAKNGERTVLVSRDPLRDWLHPTTRKPVPPRFLGGAEPKIPFGQDRRIALSEWLTSSKNPYFARNMANYLWFFLLGKGIGEPVDLVNELPLTANDPLLDALAGELIASRFDTKHMIRLIMNSRTYQLDSKPNDSNKNDDKYFSRGYARRLFSAVHQDVTTHFLEAPEEFPGMPSGTRAVHFLQRPYILDVFSRPQRLSECQAERCGLANLQSSIHLHGSSETQARLERRDNRVGRLLGEKRTDREILDDLFWAAFARSPDENARKIMSNLLTTKSRRAAWEDALWAVINTKEFAFRP